MNFEEVVRVHVPSPKIIHHAIPDKKQTNKNSNIHFNNYPENDKQLDPRKTVPGISSYLNVPKESKKVCIYSDSIVKRMDMIDFNDMCNYNSSLKRPFPGCTAPQLTHFVKPSLQEDKPDIAIIHVGTNNLTGKTQTEVEIFNEIMDVVNTCRNCDVTKIYVSALVCRPLHQEKIDGINRLLSQNAEKFDYCYIDNNNIKPFLLWRDGVHLKVNGIRILAKNFIDMVNSILNSAWV